MTSHKHGLVSLTDVINSNQGYACNNSYVVKYYNVDRREERGANTAIKLHQDSRENKINCFPRDHKLSVYLVYIDVVECYKVDGREERGKNTDTKLPVSKIMNLEEVTDRLNVKIRELVKEQ